MLVSRTSSVLRPLMGTRTAQIASSPARLGGRQASPAFRRQWPWRLTRTGEVPGFAMSTWARGRNNGFALRGEGHQQASKSSKRRFEVMPKTFWDESSQLLLKSRPRHTRLAAHHVGPAWEPQKTAERSRSAIFIYIRMPMSIHLYRQASVAWHWRESCRMDMGNAFVNRLRTSKPDAWNRSTPHET